MIENINNLLQGRKLHHSRNIWGIYRLIQWVKGFFKMVSRKVRTLTAYCLKSLILWRCAVNVLATGLCAYCTKRLKDVRWHLVLIRDIGAVVRSCLWLKLLHMYVLCLPYIPAVYHHNHSFSWSCQVPRTSRHLLLCSSGTRPLFRYTWSLTVFV